MENVKQLMSNVDNFMLKLIESIEQINIIDGKTEGQLGATKYFLCSLHFKVICNWDGSIEIADSAQRQ